MQRRTGVGRSGRAVLLLIGMILSSVGGLLTVAAEPASAGAVATHAITDTIDIQSVAQRLAISPDGTRLYATIAYNGGGALRVIDAATTTVITSITVGDYPGGVVVSPNGSRVYVANVDAGTVSVVNTITNRVVRTITVGALPRNLAINSTGSRLYVANTGSGTISVIDTATNAVIQNIGLDAVRDVVVSPDDTRLYVTNGAYNGGSLYIVATANGTITDTISVGAQPSGLAVTPDGGRVYVTHQERNYLSVVNTVTRSVTSNITVGWNATKVAVSADGTRAYAPNADDWNLSVIDTADDTVIETVGTGPDDYTVALSSDGRRIYVGNPQTNSVIVLSELHGTAPRALVATAGDRSARIAFTAGTSGGSPITKYQFQVDGGTWADAVGTTSPITITGLTNYASLRVRIRAVTAQGVSPASATVGVRPRAAAPTLTSATATGPTSISAGFTGNPVRGGLIRSYVATAYLAGTNTAAASCTTGVSGRSCSITGLTAGTDYDVRVVALVKLISDPTTRQTLDSNTITARTNN